MKNQITYLSNLFLIAFVLYASVGVSVFLDVAHATVPEVIVEVVIEENLCCQTQVVENNVETAHCCCITELRFAQFYFNNTLVDQAEVPSFMIASTTEINTQKLELMSYANILHCLELPPPKTTLKNLSLLQVYRL